MIIEKTKKFQKMYDKLSFTNKKRIKESLMRFKNNPYDPELRNHKLTWEYKWLRSIDAWFDLRIIFLEKEKGYQFIVLFKVWSHSELYW